MLTAKELGHIIKKIVCNLEASVRGQEMECDNSPAQRQNKAPGIPVFTGVIQQKSRQTHVHNLPRTHHTIDIEAKTT